MNQAVVLEVFYPHSPERVWQALTDCRALAVWMMDNNFEPRLGHKFYFRQAVLSGFEQCIDCEVIELEPPKRLAYYWQDAQTEHSTIVTWILTAVTGGTLLQLQHQPVQTTAINSSVLLQQSRAISNSIPHGKEYESPMNNLLLGLVNDHLQSLQHSSPISLTSKCGLEPQAEWNDYLMRLYQNLSSENFSDYITKLRNSTQAA